MFGNGRKLQSHDLLVRRAGADAYRLLGSLPGAACDENNTVSAHIDMLLIRQLSSRLRLTGQIVGCARSDVSLLAVMFTGGSLV